MKGYVVCVWEKIDNEEKLKDLNHGDKLAGNVYQEILLDVEFMKKIFLTRSQCLLMNFPVEGRGHPGGGRRGVSRLEGAGAAQKIVRRRTSASSTGTRTSTRRATESWRRALLCRIRRAARRIARRLLSTDTAPARPRRPA